MKKILLLLILGLSLGCATSGPEGAGTATAFPTAVEFLPPTFTPSEPSDRFFPTNPAVTVTQPTRAIIPTDTPIPFGDTAVEVRYQIPSIGLDRRLQGSISSQIVVVDETTGVSLKRSNQAGVLLDLQQVLPQLLLPVVPDDCESCVHITYNLPYGDLQGDGWLRDPAMLASLENFFTLTLGPHYPPDTVAGLRRSASPFAPAHTVALTEDGTLYSWIASEPEANPITEADPEMLASLAELSLNGVNTQYAVPCPGAPLESLYLVTGDQEDVIGIMCPEYALPTTLLPLYAQLDAAITDMLTVTATALDRPPAGLPLTAVVDYDRQDGARLTIFADGSLVARDAAGTDITGVITPTSLISLTTELIGGGVVRSGLTTFNLEPAQQISTTDGVTITISATPKPPRSVLLVRGPAGIYDREWFNSFDVPELAALNTLLANLLQTEALPEPVETPAAEVTPDFVGTAVPEPTTAPSAVPEPTAVLTATP